MEEKRRPLLSTGQTEGLSMDMMWTSFACLALGLSSSCEFFFLRKQIAKLNIKRKLHCHNPNNNPKQLKTTFVGGVLLSSEKLT